MFRGHIVAWSSCCNAALRVWSWLMGPDLAAEFVKLEAAFEDLDRPFKRAQLAMRQALELREQVRASGGRSNEALAAVRGQAKR